jgi:hypothetical protein
LSQYNIILFNKISRTTRKSINVFLAGQASDFNSIKILKDHHAPLQDNAKKILFFRQPTDWLYANWSFDKTNLDLISFTNNNYLLNHQSLVSVRTMMNIDSLDGLDIQKEALTVLDNYSFIGVFDYFYESLDLMSFLFGWPLYTPPPKLSLALNNHSISRKNIEHLSVEEFIYLQDKNLIDDLFYKRAHQIFFNLWQKYIKFIGFNGDIEQYWSYRNKYKNKINNILVNNIVPYSINIANQITIYGKFNAKSNHGVMLGQNADVNSFYFKTKQTTKHILKIWYKYMSKSGLIVKVNGKRIKSDINIALKYISITLPTDNAYSIDLIINNDILTIDQYKEINTSLLISSIVLFPQ